ncbi:hypothetical protein, partial [Vulcanococcus sp.]|uniref:hypothetical protein n=1 Tax=Vulcanococcus sp. TaxID=2856995 RepID=UPI003F698128
NSRSKALFQLTAATQNPITQSFPSASCGRLLINPFFAYPRSGELLLQLIAHSPLPALHSRGSSAQPFALVVNTKAW